MSRLDHSACNGGTRGTEFMDKFVRAGMLDPRLPGLPQPGTITGPPAAHLTFAGRSSWFAENLMSTDPTPPDARCAVNLDPL
ncbi:MAG: hypothetical protein ACRDQY_18560, partial [Pseudonocardiaceae bacterium]